MNTSLTRTIGFWLLLVLPLASATTGGWLIADQVGTMTTTLLDNTATGVDVYVGQSLVVVGAALLGAGILGVLLALALIAARSLMPTATPVVVEPIDWTAEPPEESTNTASDAISADPALDMPADLEADGQNGSSGSTATATKISVR